MFLCPVKELQAPWRHVGRTFSALEVFAQESCDEGNREGGDGDAVASRGRPAAASTGVRPQQKTAAVSFERISY